MKKMKKRYKVLLSILVIFILIVVVIFNYEVIFYKKYEFTSTGYFAGGTIDIDGVKYEQISEEKYEEIYEQMGIKGSIIFSKYKAIGRIDYPEVEDIWKYTIYENIRLKDRILLKGKTYEPWVNYPEFYFCRQDILYSYLNLTKYEYISDGYTIKGDGMIYKEIDKKTFQWIYDEFMEQRIYVFGGNVVGRINYNYADKWKFVLYGKENQQERILLTGKEQYAFYDKEYPQIYFCRQDVLESLEGFDLFESLEGIDLDRFLD